MKPWNDKKIQQLISVLIGQTEAGRLDWEYSRIPRSSSLGDGFSYSTSQATVHIGTVRGDGAAPYIFMIRNSDGAVVERFVFPENRSSSSLISTRLTSDESAFLERMERLYTAVRRKVLNPDAVVDSILGELGES